jgi:hypothetical protein
VKNKANFLCVRFCANSEISSTLLDGFGTLNAAASTFSTAKGEDMHIHGAQQNLSHSLQSARESSADFAAQQAASTRKKLLSAAATIDAGSSAESAWMITAWDGNGSKSPASRGGSQPDAAEHAEPFNPAQPVQTTTPPAASTRVSFWA